MLAVGQAQTIRDFRACDAFNASERLADLPVPLLAIVGASDALTPPKFAQFLADRVPEGSARIVEGAGHFAMVERPEETNALSARSSLESTPVERNVVRRLFCVLSLGLVPRILVAAPPRPKSHPAPKYRPTPAADSSPPSAAAYGPDLSI